MQSPKKIKQPLNKTNFDNSKTETETKHKNFKCDKIQKLKLWQNLKKENCDKNQNSNCDNS